MRTLEVLTPLLVCMWVLVGLSRACTPPYETTELKAYRADIIVDATIRLQGQDIIAIVSKTLKGDIGGQSEILVTGFGTEEPCFVANTELEEGTPGYVLYLAEDLEGTIGGETSRTYMLSANPDVADGNIRRKVRKVGQKGKRFNENEDGTSDSSGALQVVPSVSVSPAVISFMCSFALFYATCHSTSLHLSLYCL